MNNEQVHLYVEKISKQRKEILLDFVDEREFLHFKNRGDYISVQSLTRGEYQPTMILVHSFSPKRKMWKGSMITMDMEHLFELCHNQVVDGSDAPSSVIVELHNGDSFAALIDREEACGISRSVPDEYKRTIEGTWEGSPCALENMKTPFELCIWDVGQGNTNSICDGDNLALFDFGASFYYGRQKVESIIQNHSKIINETNLTTLIVSHWDIDHYKMLCHVTDSFLSNICCVFCPPTAIGLTASQVAERIQDKCKRINVISPALCGGRWCGVEKVCEGDRYCLYVGEKSSSKNNSGLLLLVKGKTDAALLTSDHSNYQIWKKVYPDIDENVEKLHVVIPHHGGKCGNTKVRNSITPGDACISVGGNIYGHPSVSVIDEYINNGYKVKRTDLCGKDIVEYL